MGTVLAGPHEQVKVNGLQLTNGLVLPIPSSCYALSVFRVLHFLIFSRRSGSQWKQALNCSMRLGGCWIPSGHTYCPAKLELTPLHTLTQMTWWLFGSPLFRNRFQCFI